MFKLTAGGRRGEGGARQSQTKNTYSHLYREVVRATLPQVTSNGGSNGGKEGGGGTYYREEES